MSTPPPLLRLDSVNRAFDGGAVVALRGVNLLIDAHDSVALVGASGSGKSTLIAMMSGIDVPTEGKVYWQDGHVHTRREWAALRASQIGIVFQDFNLLPTLTAVEQVELAMVGRNIATALRRTRATMALERVGLAARLGHLPHALSGGERQRVAIARSIVNGPRLLLADEPTGNLDSANAATVADLLFGLQREGATLVIATHDDTLAKRCRRRLRIKDGEIVEDIRNTPPCPDSTRGAAA